MSIKDSRRQSPGRPWDGFPLPDHIRQLLWLDPGCDHGHGGGYPRRFLGLACENGEFVVTTDSKCLFRITREGAEEIVAWLHRHRIRTRSIKRMLQSEHHIGLNPVQAREIERDICGNPTLPLARQVITQGEERRRRRDPQGQKTRTLKGRRAVRRFVARQEDNT